VIAHEDQKGYLVSLRGVMEVLKVALIESLTHERGLVGQVRIIGLNVRGNGRAINEYSYGGGQCKVPRPQPP
jgi:hypothetical protein